MLAHFQRYPSVHLDVLDPLVEVMIKENPDDRPTAAEVARRLKDIVDSTPREILLSPIARIERF
jgi:hypothetical protein